MAQARILESSHATDSGRVEQRRGVDKVIEGTARIGTKACITQNNECDPYPFPSLRNVVSEGAAVCWQASCQ